MNKFVKSSSIFLVLILVCSGRLIAQSNDKSEEIISRAIGKLGGKKYLDVKTAISEGKFSLLKDGVNASYQTFTDVIVFPDRERTDFSEGGLRTIQVNEGKRGWVFEEKTRVFRDQGEVGIEAFLESMRSNYDLLLRGNWKNDAKLSYVGRRPSTIGKRNEVVKLAFDDGFEVEFEFDDEGLPIKSLYRSKGSGESAVEETRFNRFVDYQGILTPTLIDHFIDQKQIYRIAKDNVFYNRLINDEIFFKPASPKQLKKMKF